MQDDDDAPDRTSVPPFRRKRRLTTTDGIYLGSRLVIEGDMTGLLGQCHPLQPTVDVAVLETARGGILRSGLGFDECDVGVVLNVTADHLGCAEFIRSSSWPP